MNISIIIIAKNEESVIEDCINSAQLISDDIILADTGSKDQTTAIAEACGAKVIQISWMGFGASRNEAVKFAKYDWVLALDADERITENLKESLLAIKLDNPNKLYGFQRVSFIANKQIRFGDWGRDKVFRLYNKKVAEWNLAKVHEEVVGTQLKKEVIKGVLLHFTMDSMATYWRKTELYARLSAEKYFADKKRATFIKRYLSPVFSFIQTYIIRLGFLDGKEGLVIAWYSAAYVWMKYKGLAEKYKQEAVKK